MSELFAIVTGAASGIGFATARRLAHAGYDIGLVDVDEDGLLRAEKAVGELDRTGLPAVFDLADAGEFGSVVEEFRTRWAHIDGLVNNAGIAVAAPLVDTEDADWDRIIAVNLTAMFKTARAVLPPMLEAGGGAIVNVSSVAGIVGVRNRAAYCASKAGVLGLTRSIAVDYADRGIRANAICPGTVDTEWIGKILANAEDPAATRKQMEARQLDGRMGSPEEVANGIAFLLSDESRFVNGAAFVMDGGMTAI